MGGPGGRGRLRGSPHRVLLSVVEGEVRYENGVTEWQELDRRRSQRAGTHARGNVAAARAPRARVAADDELFFSRIRRQGKWIFALISIVFILSTVLLGVGTGFGGLQDILSSQSGGGVSADDARAAIRENPNDAQAYRDLSVALQADGKLDEAIPPLARYVRKSPNDTDARRELAGLYLRQATSGGARRRSHRSRSRTRLPARRSSRPATRRSARRCRRTRSPPRSRPRSTRS